MILIYKHLREAHFTEIVNNAKKKNALCQKFQKAHHQTHQSHKLSILTGPKRFCWFQIVEWPKRFRFINLCTTLFLLKSSQKQKRVMPYAKNFKKHTLKLSRLIEYHS